ncbi:Transcription factor RfeD, partial [Teratosphaeria destructans]
MQEHIRRAHPEYYLPKLPATRESFELMITTAPHERPPQDTHGNPVQLPQPSHSHAHAHAHSHSHSDPSR